MTTREPGRIPPNPYHEQAWLIGDPVIGEGTWIGAFTTLDGSGGLTIGEGCDIGCGTRIYTHSTAKRCVSGRRYSEVERTPVTIGDRVFISGNVVINPGVTIGDEAMVLAGSVVTNDVAPRTIVAGVPARKIGDIDLTDPDNPQFV